MVTERPASSVKVSGYLVAGACEAGCSGAILAGAAVQPASAANASDASATAAEIREIRLPVMVRPSVRSGCPRPTARAALAALRVPKRRRPPGGGLLGEGFRVAHAPARGLARDAGLVLEGHTSAVAPDRAGLLA